MAIPKAKVITIASVKGGTGKTKLQKSNTQSKKKDRRTYMH